MSHMRFSLISDAVVMLQKNLDFQRGAALFPLKITQKQAMLKKCLTCRERFLFGLYGAILR